MRDNHDVIENAPHGRQWLVADSSVGRTARAILIVLLLAVAVRSVAVNWTSPHEPARTINDFTGDYVSARALVEARNAYAETFSLARGRVANPKLVSLLYGGIHVRNPHPPAYILLVTPLARLPYVTARNLWLILMALSIALAMAMVAKVSGSRRSTSAAVAFGSLALPPALAELRIGEVNALLLLAAVIGWQQLRKGRSIRAGVILGVTSAVKLYPLFLVIALLRRRNVKAALTQVVTAILITVAAGLVVGEETTLRLASTIMPDNTRLWLNAPHNLSLIAVPFRWLTLSSWNSASADIPWLAYTLALGLGLLCVIAAITTPARLSQDIFWATTPWMLLVSPLLWYEYTIFSLPLIYLILANHIAARRPPPWFVMIATALLLVWTFQIFPTRHESAAGLVGIFALPTYGLLILGCSEWHLSRAASMKTPKTTG